MRSITSGRINMAIKIHSVIQKAFECVVLERLTWHVGETNSDLEFRDLDPSSTFATS